MRDDADDATVARHLEAYILWLFGWIMFCSSQGDSCPKQLIPLERSIADAPLHEVPQFSWASAVLATTYRGPLHGRDEGLSRGAHLCWVPSTDTALVVRALPRGSTRDGLRAIRPAVPRPQRRRQTDDGFAVVPQKGTLNHCCYLLLPDFEMLQINIKFFTLCSHLGSACR